MSGAKNQLFRYNRPLPSLWDDDVFSPTDVFLDKILSKISPEFSDIFGSNIFETSAYPKVDVRETETEFIIESEIPGLTRDQVKVEVSSDTLLIKGEKREEIKKEGRYHTKEIKRSSFVRSWKLSPKLVDKNTIKAKFQDGLLEVKIKKIEPYLPGSDTNVITIE